MKIRFGKFEGNGYAGDIREATIFVDGVDRGQIEQVYHDAGSTRVEYRAVGYSAEIWHGSEIGRCELSPVFYYARTKSGPAQYESAAAAKRALKAWIADAIA